MSQTAIALVPLSSKILRERNQVGLDLDRVIPDVDANAEALEAILARRLARRMRKAWSMLRVGFVLPVIAACGSPTSGDHPGGGGDHLAPQIWRFDP